MIIQSIKITKHFPLLLFIGLLQGQMFDTRAISFVIGDSETDMSMLDLSLSKHFNEKHALFLRAGTFALVNPVCICLKQYKKTDKQSLYSFFSIQYIMLLKNHIVPTLGIVSERVLKDNQKIKLGLMVFPAPNGFGAGPILRFERNF